MEGRREEIISTNDDATLAKSACVRRKYYHDEFVEYFLRVDKKFTEKSSNEIDLALRAVSPLMTRGYWSRVTTLKLAIKSFLNHKEGKKQIVSLGSGFDTNFFQMKKDNLIDTKNHIIYELDLPPVVENKIKVISETKKLEDLIFEDQFSSQLANSTSIHTSWYHLVSADLTELNSVIKALDESGIDKKVPTLFISECVLIYIKPELSNLLIKWISDSFPICGFWLYEQIKPNDAFGTIMMKNLQERGCPLLSLQTFPDEASQKKRFETLGFEKVQAKDMNYIFNIILDPKEKQRVNKLEMLDELEEWILIQSHYCIVWATQNKSQNIEFWNQFRFKLE